jgi:hypothetical protein
MTGRDFDELISVQRAFAAWRASRPHSKAAIPEELWEMAVGLLGRHSASTVGKRLGLNPTLLSRRKTELLKDLVKEDVGAEFAVVSIPAVPPSSVSNTRSCPPTFWFRRYSILRLSTITAFTSGSGVFVLSFILAPDRLETVSRRIFLTKVRPSCGMRLHCPEGFARKDYSQRTLR